MTAFLAYGLLVATATLVALLRMLILLWCAVFRSAPDMWAIQQLFPVMPIHRLDEQPTVPAILADLTCGQSPSVSQLHLWLLFQAWTR